MDTIKSAQAPTCNDVLVICAPCHHGWEPHVAVVTHRRVQAGDNRLVRLLVAPSQSGPALRAALQARTAEHGLTVLGSVVAWGYVRTMAILGAACRYEGVIDSTI